MTQTDPAKCGACGQPLPAGAPAPTTGRFKAGLEDVVAGTSSICLVDGVDGRLLYRGYDIKDLADHSTFAEVAYLLWYGRLPGRKEFDQFLQIFRGSIELPEETVEIMRLFPKHARQNFQPRFS